MLASVIVKPSLQSCRLAMLRKQECSQSCPRDKLMACANERQTEKTGRSLYILKHLLHVPIYMVAFHVPHELILLISKALVLRDGRLRICSVNIAVDQLGRFNWARRLEPLSMLLRRTLGTALRTTIFRISLSSRAERLTSGCGWLLKRS